jgi:very-short-patch-repair endonuclease
MVWEKDHSTSRAAWALARRQHGVLAHGQLLALGFSRRGIEHRIARGRLHRVRRGVYAVGRAELGQNGRWMAAVLACGANAVLSHSSAAALWQLDAEQPDLIELSVPPGSRCRQRGLLAHRRALRPEDRVKRNGIRVTSPALTLVDMAARLDRFAVERAVGEADKHDLVDPETLRLALEDYPRARGAAFLREVLDRRTLRLTDSELERLFLSIVRETGLPLPLTQQTVNGFRVDFHWPDLGLVVETDGLRYHRTPAQQSRDQVRDQMHAAAGLTALRFTFAQVKLEPAYVRGVLTAVIARLESGRGTSAAGRGTNR